MASFKKASLRIDPGEPSFSAGIPKRRGLLGATKSVSSSHVGKKTAETITTKRSWTPREKEVLGSLTVEPLNKLQHEVLTKMRCELYDDLLRVEQHEEVVSDRRLLRFLRGASYNIKDAVALFREMLNWRKEKNVDKIRNEIVQNELKPVDFPHSGRIKRYYLSNRHYNQDKEGRIVHVELIGRVPVKKLLSCFHESEWMTHHIYEMEYLMIQLDRQTKETKKLSRIVSIYDFFGLNKGHLHRSALGLFKQTLKITQLYYPEMMERCFFINSPVLFTMTWSMIKPWIAERSVKKIEILGKNYYS